MPVCRSHTRRSGFTLVEMMVSVTLALLMILAVVTVFEWLGDSVAFGRATIEMSGELQTATSQVQRDIDNCTCDAKPWVEPGEGAGYFYINEYDPARVAAQGLVSAAGLPLTNDKASLLSNASNMDPERENFFQFGSQFGDLDDVLAMTVRSTGKPFSGVDGNGQFVESSHAEITYMVLNAGTPEAPLVNLYRKVRLVLPASNTPASGMTPGGDIAFRLDANGNPVALSLSDLSLLENRFYTRLNDQGRSGTVRAEALAEMLQPENILMQDVLGFDVRVYDPNAPIYQVDGIALRPGDSGFQIGNGELIGRGAFVDVAYGLDQPDPTAINSKDFSNGPGEYNTMPWAVVMGGAGADGLDTPSLGTGQKVFGVDDASERVDRAGAPFNPPYDLKLRGIEVKLRTWEVQTGQVMQTSVVGDFVPK